MAIHIDQLFIGSIVVLLEQCLGVGKIMKGWIIEYKQGNIDLKSFPL
jgi:hypothetical protein